MKTRVLVVDDSPLIRAILREAFASTPDLEVVGEAEDGQDAVAKVQNLRPDIVTMDVVMPKMDGLAATDEIMRVAPTPIVVIARDGGDARALAVAALGHGALGVFPKPARGFAPEAAAALADLIRTLARERGAGSSRGDPGASSPDKIRVLVVDDSSLVREVLRIALSRTSDIEVVGEAADGVTAVALAAKLRPDVVTLDLLMPMMDGHETARKILRSSSPGVLVIAQDGPEAARLLESQGDRAAVDVFLKPKAGLDENKLAELVSAIRRLAQGARSRPPAPPPAHRGTRSHGSASIIGIVGSTGATRVLGDLVAALPVDFPVPLVLVQHTERGFTERLAAWLASMTTLRVRLGTAGHLLVPGDVVLAPDDLHMEVHTGGRVHLHAGEPVDGFRPSGSVLLDSLARSFGARAAGLVLSGMGNDGASGLGAIAAAGGSAVVEDPATAAVAGMPERALARAGGALALPAPRLAALLVDLATARSRPSA